MVRWRIGMLVCCLVGVLVCWSVLVIVCWCARSAGGIDYWSVGSLECGSGWVLNCHHICYKVSSSVSGIQRHIRPVFASAMDNCVAHALASIVFAC
jgi:hypothetical protein